MTGLQTVTAPANAPLVAPDTLAAAMPTPGICPSIPAAESFPALAAPSAPPDIAPHAVISSEDVSTKVDPKAEHGGDNILFLLTFSLLFLEK